MKQQGKQTEHRENRQIWEQHQIITQMHYRIQNSRPTKTETKT